MSVIRANMQTVEDIYRLIWAAVASKRPVEAMYQKHPRLLCPHRLGRNSNGQVRVLCYQAAGGSKTGLAPPGSPKNWRCLALEELRQVKLTDEIWRTAANHSRPARCVVDPDIDAED